MVECWTDGIGRPYKDFLSPETGHVICRWFWFPDGAVHDCWFVEPTQDYVVADYCGSAPCENGGLSSKKTVQRQAWCAVIADADRQGIFDGVIPEPELPDRFKSAFGLEVR